MRNGRTTYERGKQSAVRPAGSTRTRKVTECAASVPDASLSGRSAAAEVTPRGLGRTFVDVIPARRGSTLAERLAALSIPEPNSGCHLWLGYMHSTGYGYMMFRKNATGAHRVSWLAHRGPIPAGMHVCHKCDNRLCVNPDHLFLGTNAENTADKMAKGRYRRGTNMPPHKPGESNGASVLSEAQAREILTISEPARIIAVRFGVCINTVYNIRAGRSWRHLPRGED
jgi:hypothetical protein